VIATQTGYLIGGLVIVETLFNYPGSAADRHCCQQQGLPDAGSGRSHHRHGVPRGDPDR
jgi:hypothetical protein